MGAHVFVDNSNIFGGARRTAKTIEPGVPPGAVRIHYKNFFDLIEGPHSGTTFTRVLAGAVPPGNEELWSYAEKRGYKTDLLKKVASATGKLFEQGVDEVLHLKIANTLLDHKPGVLILATGDGQLSDFDTSFTTQVHRALSHGWNVEVWSWKSQLSGAFSKLTPPKGQLLTINELDPYYRSVTFIKGGIHKTGKGPINVPERKVQALK